MTSGADLWNHYAHRATSNVWMEYDNIGRFFCKSSQTPAIRAFRAQNRAHFQYSPHFGK